MGFVVEVGGGCRNAFVENGDQFVIFGDDGIELAGFDVAGASD